MAAGNVYKPEDVSDTLCTILKHYTGRWISRTDFAKRFPKGGHNWSKDRSPAMFAFNALTSNATNAYISWISDSIVKAGAEFAREREIESVCSGASGNAWRQGQGVVGYFDGAIEVTGASSELDAALSAFLNPQSPPITFEVQTNMRMNFRIDCEMEAHVAYNMQPFVYIGTNANIALSHLGEVSSGGEIAGKIGRALACFCCNSVIKNEP